MVYLFLADGFEIIEAMAPIDMLRRADIEIKTVGVTGKTVTSSCSIEVNADITIDEFEYKNADAVILPGGGDGVINLEKNSAVQNVIDRAVEDGIYICAICAAPSILGNKGLLSSVEATAYPSFTKYLDGAVLSEQYVITDGKYITARGAGVSVEDPEMYEQIRFVVESEHLEGWQPDEEDILMLLDEAINPSKEIKAEIDRIWGEENA